MEVGKKQAWIGHSGMWKHKLFHFLVCKGILTNYLADNQVFFSKFYRDISQVKDSECPHQMKSYYVLQNGLQMGNVSLQMHILMLSMRYLPRQDH